MNFVGMTAGAGALLVVSAAAGETLALPEAGKTQIALVYLVAATVALFLMVLVVVQRWAASSTSYIFVLMPVVAVALGASSPTSGSPRRRSSAAGSGALGPTLVPSRVVIVASVPPSIDVRRTESVVGLSGGVVVLSTVTA